VLRKLGTAGFAEVFRRPPTSSQQILHPEKYFDHVEPTLPAFPPISLGKGYKDLTDGMLGELDHAILLRQYATSSQAAAISPHWKGGRYSLLENKKESRIVLRYVSEWDSPDVAADFFRIYKSVLRKKWKKIDVASESDDTESGTGDDGYFVIGRTGALVSSLEGLASPDQAKPRSSR